MMASPTARRRTKPSAFVVYVLMMTFSTAALASEEAKTYTNDNTFYIPFTVDLEPASNRTDAVRLYVSGDRGGTWELYQSKPPSEQRFLFRAGVDGEFWFAVNTASEGVATDEPNDMRRELIVVLDQVAPEIQLTSRASSQRTVSLNFTIREANLDAGECIIEYRPGADTPWTTVPSPQALALSSADEWRGSLQWIVGGTKDTIDIRATVTDRAGNTTVVERRLALSQPMPAATQNMPMTTAAAPVTPINPPPINPPTALNVGGDSPSPNGWQLSNEVFSPPAPQFVRGTRPGLTPPGPSPSSSSRPDAQLPFDSERLSRSKRFQLEYEIEGQETLQIHRVEVWGTNDKGLTWRHLGDDGDKRSPFLVTVPDDGVYGFRLLVQAQEGLPVRPPMNGDAPDVWVRVDSTPPAARVTAARFGRGPTLGQLEVQWEANDQDLTQSPVTLLFGESSDGPWRIMADNLANSGYFSWKVDDRVPRDLYLRLEVQDRSGNIGSHTLSDPLRADGLLPKGRIRNIRPTSALQPATGRRPIWWAN